MMGRLQLPREADRFDVKFEGWKGRGMEGLVGDRYRVESQLGAGGSATVWLVTDLALDRPAALKLLTEGEGTGESRRDRLRTEARSLAVLDHPNVVRVYDLGTHEGSDFIVMEYLERGSLSDRLRSEGTVAPSEAVAVAIQVIDGLGAAHQAGIVHRDVKPGNILIRADGRVALCDFGIARTASGGDTHTGVALGSAGFMAPEQRVDARRAGPQADLYAAACTLYNLLTNDTPVDLYLASDSSPRWEAVPVPLRSVLRRATRPEPSQRFQSADEMTAALRAVEPALVGLPAARGGRSHNLGHPPTRADSEPSLQAERRDRGVAPEEWAWARRRSAPVGRTAVWVGVAVTLLVTGLFVGLGPLRTGRRPLPVEVAGPAPSAGLPQLAGLWMGTFDGNRGQLALRGPVTALRGEVIVHLGAHQLRSSVQGRWIDGTLVLTDLTSTRPETYRAHLGPSGLVLEGELVRPDALPMPFALVRVE